MGVILYALVLVWAGIAVLALIYALIRGAVAYTGGGDGGMTEILHAAGGLIFGMIGAHLVMTAPPWGAGPEGKVAVIIGLSLGLAGFGYLAVWVFWPRR